MSQIGGLDVGRMLQQGFEAVGKKGQSLEAKMTAAMGKGELSQQEMLSMQFEIGQFNAMTELLSSVGKSLTDTMKTLGQRTS